MTKQEFIEQAKAIYDNSYDYKYIQQEELKPYDSIPIICSKHGLFYETVYQHLKGNGCFKCLLKKEKMTDF